MRAGIAASLRAVDAAVAACDIAVLDTAALVKDDVKAAKLSPDGVMQAAMQLAHWRLHGYTPSTYESASTSGYKHGAAAGWFRGRG